MSEASSEQPVSGRRRFARGAIIVGLTAVPVLVAFWLSYPFLFPDRSDNSFSPEFDTSDNQDSIVISGKWPTLQGGTIENGTSYEQTAIDLRAWKKIALPSEAEVIRRAQGKLVIFVGKNLGWCGHIRGTRSIREVRKGMGCSIKAEGDTLNFATYGTWSSIEGGASLTLIFLVPKDVEVIQMAGAEEVKGPWLEKSPDLKEGYWFDPPEQGDGWRKIPMRPDPRQFARGGKSHPSQVP